MHSPLPTRANPTKPNIAIDHPDLLCRADARSLINFEIRRGFSNLISKEVGHHCGSRKWAKHQNGYRLDDGIIDMPHDAANRENRDLGMAISSIGGGGFHQR
jgi:hypothetical protein